MDLSHHSTGAKRVQQRTCETAADQENSYQSFLILHEIFLKNDTS